MNTSPLAAPRRKRQPSRQALGSALASRLVCMWCSDTRFFESSFQIWKFWNYPRRRTKCGTSSGLIAYPLPSHPAIELNCWVHLLGVSTSNKLLEDVCIYNHGILEVSTSRSTASSSNSSNNNTTIISNKLIFCTTNRSLHSTFIRNYPASACCLSPDSSLTEEERGSFGYEEANRLGADWSLRIDWLCADKKKRIDRLCADDGVCRHTKKKTIGVCRQWRIRRVSLWRKKEGSVCRIDWRISKKNSCVEWRKRRVSPIRIGVCLRARRKIRVSDRFEVNEGSCVD